MKRSAVVILAASLMAAWAATGAQAADQGNASPPKADGGAAAQINTGPTPPAGNTVTDNLNRLVMVNLQEVSNLRAELDALKDNHAARFVWLIMIQQHSESASMLARLDRMEGGKPDTTVPQAMPLMGKPESIIMTKLMMREDLLKTVKEFEHNAKGHPLDVLRRFEKVVKNQIGNLKSIARGYSLTGI